ncbi:MAG: hypothetical protein Kow0031_11400 [Anaerolineae bacterium]
MVTRKYATLSVLSLLILLLSFGLMTACNGTQQTVEVPFQTNLLVSEPANALTTGEQYEIKSRTQSSDGVSHVELYVVEYVPLGGAPPEVAAQLPYQNVLISSQAAPYNQTIFTANQPFIPKQPGEYLIKVVGYNKVGERSESQYLRFTAVTNSAAPSS